MKVSILSNLSYDKQYIINNNNPATEGKTEAEKSLPAPSIIIPNNLISYVRIHI